MPPRSHYLGHGRISIVWWLFANAARACWSISARHHVESLANALQHQPRIWNVLRSASAPDRSLKIDTVLAIHANGDRSLVQLQGGFEAGLLAQCHFGITQEGLELEARPGPRLGDILGFLTGGWRLEGRPGPRSGR